jgi:F-type H+-transporting ATPase subunit b
MAASAPAEGAHGAAEQAAGAAEHASGGSDFPPFDPTLFSSQLFWFAIAFGVLYYVMSRVALPRVAQTLEARRLAIAADLDAARAAGESAEAARVQHERLLAEARAKARAELDNVRTKSSAAIVAQTQKAEADVAQKVASAESKLRDLRNDAMANVRATASELAMAITQKVGGIGVTKAEAEAAVDGSA